MDDEKSPDRKSKIDGSQESPMKGTESLKNLKSRSKLKKNAGDMSDASDGESSPNNKEKKQLKVSYFFIFSFFRNLALKKLVSFPEVSLKISPPLIFCGLI